MPETPVYTYQSKSVKYEAPRGGLWATKLKIRFKWIVTTTMCIKVDMISMLLKNEAHATETLQCVDNPRKLATLMTTVV